jgi:selenocysteine lyase/cysteine desulfurase
MLDARLIREEFPQADDIVYLNHAGVAPLPASTARAIAAFAQDCARVGAARYAEWMAREQRVREQLAAFINAPSPADIALLKNTSEALSVVAEGLDWRWGDNVVGADEEFPSNRMPWEAQARLGVAWRGVPLQGPDPEAALMHACDERTRVLAVSSVQYGSGLRLHLEKLGRFCRERGILFCVDAIQSLGAIRFDVEACRADFVAADAHKWLLGPEGIALFYTRESVRPRLALRQFGWHMANNAGDFDAREWRPAGDGRRFECGSPNTLGIYALSASLELFARVGMENVEQAVLETSGRLIAELEGIPGVAVLTPKDPGRRAGIVTFRVEGRAPGELQKALADRGVVCAARGGGVRFSPHFYTGRERIDRAIEILREVL